MNLDYTDPNDQFRIMDDTLAIRTPDGTIYHIDLATISPDFASITIKHPATSERLSAKYNVTRNGASYVAYSAIYRPTVETMETEASTVTGALYPMSGIKRRR